MKQWFGGGWRCRRTELPHPENGRSNIGHKVVEVVGLLQSRGWEERVQFGRFEMYVANMKGK